MEVLKKIGILIIGFIPGFIVVFFLSLLCLKFCLHFFVNQDNMSQGIAGSLFFLFLCLPASCIGGIISGLISLSKFSKTERKIEEDSEKYMDKNAANTEDLNSETGSE